VPIIGTDPEDIDLAEDRKLFGKLLDQLKIPCPENGTATSVEEACVVAARIGYPVLVRPSYVLGGRAMVIAYDEEMVRQYMREAVTFSQDRPVLVDRFLDDATEVDVDALGDGTDVLIAGIMEHIEEAGVHSGDSSCVLPATSLSAGVLASIEAYTVKLARALFAPLEVRMKLLRNPMGGTLQIFLKVVPDWLMHSFFPQITNKSLSSKLTDLFVRFFQQLC